ncbi:hypothetical protein [Streptomyces sp. WM6372]|uniref:hypothetical protein n=1 Tax=Streptomyces sp. WM6372 TaxID=1415555 RepID=UPI000EE42E82|nr:hypothetical protein [Streptomyces sp. WM6372]
MRTRMKSAVVTASLAAGLIGALAPNAFAAYTQVKNFSFTDEGVGAETGRWSAPGNSQAATQDGCATSNGAQGRVGYDFKIDKSWQPDQWVAWRDWSCDNGTFWKEFNNAPAGSYYMQIANAPAFIHSSGRVVYNWK